MRWHEVNGEQLAPVSPPEPAGDVELQIVRTVPEHIYAAVPRGDFRILESYVARAPQRAERFIYLENQFLWSPEIARLLRDKLVDPPSPDFRILLRAAVQPEERQRRHPRRPRRADRRRRRQRTASSPARSTPARAPRTDPIYVHAKIAIVDDRWLTLGSANLNEHSLFNDTEMNIVTHDPGARRAERGCASGQSTSSSPSTRSRPIRSARSTSSGNRSARSNSNAAPAASRSPTGSSGCRTSRDDPARILGPINGLVVDG